jgi:hypothetical protein
MPTHFHKEQIPLVLNYIYSDGSGFMIHGAVVLITAVIPFSALKVKIYKTIILPVVL